MSELEELVNREVERFIARANAHASEDIQRPRVAIRTEPSIMYYDSDEGDTGTLVAPVWKDVHPDQQAVFNAWAASVDDSSTGEEFFVENFNWFIIAHELAHHLQTQSAQPPISRYRGEEQATEVAIAYWKQVDRPRLDRLMAQIKSILEAMDVPGSTDQEFFDANYETIGSQPQIYGWFQNTFIANAYERVDELSLATIISDDLGL